VSTLNVDKVDPSTGTTLELGTSGDTINIPSGVTIANAGTATGFAGISWQSVQTSTVTAVAGNGYPVNTTSGEITVNLPAGVAGEQVGVVDYAGTFDTNQLTIAANGSEKINGSTDDVYLVTEREGGTLTYVDATQGWLMTSSAPDPGFSPPSFVTATGPDGAAGTTDGDYKYHTFTATKTGSNGFSVSNAGSSAGSNTVEYLVIAGGGGSGQNSGGGGGAGGYRTATGLSVSATDYDVTIGAGGAASDASVTGPGVVGSDSIFSTITSDGGGYGGGGGGGPKDGGDGGSGGGAGTSTSDGGNTGGSATAGQGNDGGDSYGGTIAPPGRNGGGGGGAGAVGADAASGQCGNGGNGLASSITGSSVTRGGGGGGGSRDGGGTAGTGGSGGGGAAGADNSVGTSGTANTGGGGGAGDWTYTCGAGGSGVVIIRYKFQ
jgi:hypothetical protein